MTRERLSLSLLIAYALPGFAVSLLTIPVFIYLPKYYAADMGVGLAAAGTALLLARMIDAISDPVVGVLSDRWQTRFGRRKPWIAVGAPLAGLAVVKLFMPEEGAASAGYLTFWAAVLYVGWTLINLPYQAWGAELSPDYDERSRITGGREMAMLVGVLAAAAVPPAMGVTGMGEAVPARVLEVLAILALTTGAASVCWLLFRVPEVEKWQASPLDWRRGLKAAAGNRPFRRLLASWLINGIANGLPATLFLLFCTHALQTSPTETGILIFVYFLCGVLGAPAWIGLSGRIGKHRAWCWAMIWACALFIWVPLLGPGDFWWFLVICVGTGLSLGADLALPPSMQADVVDLDALEVGKKRTGLFFALWSMAQKGALALAVGIAFPALEWFGFDPNAQSNSATALLALAALYALLPTVLKLVSIALMWTHPIDAARQREIRTQLEERG